jgi:lipopolysaccharide transport system ATP-binding protein
MPTVISVENLSKSYQLGTIGTGTFSRDLELWWAKVRGKPNPFLKIGETEDRRLATDSVFGSPSSVLWALRDVSFKVEQGEVLGIIGRNGAGKSTLLKILSRVTAPTSGKIKVKGRVASLLEVGTGFHPELTGRENVYLNGAILGMTKQEVTRKFDEIVDFAGVEKFIDTPVKRYSSGMYVRLAFAVAAHLEPEILVVDEVLAVGDAEFQKKCLGKMGEVAHEGRTVLFVSHNMAAIAGLCPRAALFDRGILVKDDKTERTISAYLNSNALLTQTSLKDRQDRQGNGLMKFTNVWVEDENNRRVENVRSGHNVKLRASFKLRTDTIISPQFSFTIQDSHGIRISDLWSESTGYVIDKVKQDGIITCVLPRLPLNQGDYFVAVWCGMKNSTYDLVWNAAKIHVVAGDFFGSGKLPSIEHGVLLIDQHWALDS